jgi:putative peptidoglycan lipid II flippase
VPFSVHHQMLRGFYAFEDTRTPVTINVWIAASHITFSLLCWWLLPLRWVVVGVAASYSLSYVVGATISARRLRARLGGLDGQRVLRTYNRLILASALAALPAVLVSFLTSQRLGIGLTGSSVTILVGGGLMMGAFLVLARRMRIEELNELVGTVTGRLSKSA